MASCIKIQEKSPLKFTLTKGLSFLSPQVTLDSSLREERLSIVLQALVENRWLKGIEADQIHRELSEICSNIAVINHLKTFDRKTDRLDTLWLKDINQSAGTFSANMGKFLRIILSLSHGNAGLERGFSVNKECLVENLSEESLVAQRQIHDAVLCSGGVEGIEV